MILQFTKTISVLMLAALVGLFQGCSRESEEVVRPIDLALLVDQASLSGDVVDFNHDNREPSWREVFREDFVAETWKRWYPAPNQVPPVLGDAGVREKWSAALLQLEQQSRLSEQREVGRDSLLQIEGPFNELRWMGYFVPVSVEGGRRYRISADIQVDQADVINPEKVGYLGFLELDNDLPVKDVYTADDIAPYLVAEQRSPGWDSQAMDWRKESFSLVLREETKTLLLYVCAYWGEGMRSGEVRFDNLLVETLETQPLADYIESQYLTPYTELVTQRNHLFKLAGRGHPTEQSQHLEGLVSPGTSRYDFQLPETRGADFSFNYGPLLEFSGLRQGRMVFRVSADGKEVFQDAFDFSRDEGRAAWRSKRIRLPEGTNRLQLETIAEGVSRSVAGFWGAPRLIPEQESPQRSVLVVCVDSLRKDYSGLYDGAVAMPEVAELAAESVVYDNYLSAGNSTRYAQTALLTGRYAGMSGLHLETVYDFLPSAFQKHFAANVPVLPGVFRGQGYLTFAALDNPFFLPIETGLPMGFAEVVNTGLKEGAYELTTDRALAFIEQADDQPFFAFVHYDPDYLWKIERTGETQISATQLKSMYFSELALIDQQVGRLLDALKKNGRFDNVDLVFVSDHGESLDPQRTGHGYTLDADQVIVPLLVKTGREDKDDMFGERRGTLVSSVDIAPWLLQEHHLPVPDSFVGEAQSLEGQTGGERIVFSEGVGEQRLLILRNPGIYVLNRDGSDRLFAVSESPEVLRDYRAIATDFLSQAVPGLYLWLDKPASNLEPLSLSLNAESELRFIGRRPGDLHKSSDSSGVVNFTDKAGAMAVVLPLATLKFPLELGLQRDDDRVPLSLPPEFLPTGPESIEMSSQEELMRLFFPEMPKQVVGQGGHALWFSPARGAVPLAGDAKRLDPALRKMLQRWGYIK